MVGELIDLDDNEAEELMAKNKRLRGALNGIELECRARIATGCGYDVTIHEIVRDALCTEGEESK